jgi:amidophosphoribosyltransferase
VVRGNTMPKIVDLLRRGGATAIHLRISAPPIAHPCHFGIDMGERESLVAHGRDMEGIRRELGADTLGYLSLEGLLRAAGERNRCLGCLTGRYPVSIDGASSKDALENADATAVPIKLHLRAAG